MNVRACYAALGLIICFFAPVACAQEDDLFGSGGEVPAAIPGAPADPAAAAVEALDADKTLLAAEQPATNAADGADFCRCVGESDSAAIARIEKALQGQLSSNGIGFSETPLEEVVSLLQEEYGIPIQLDEKALEATGIDSTEPVTINLRNISLKSALRLMLNKLNLTYIIREEVLLITTPEEAESQLRTCVYNVRGFIDDSSDKSMDALIDTIISCVRTETWAENGGGEAEIRPLKPGLLVISQTQAVHDDINSLLKSIRDMRDGNAMPMDGAAAPAADDQSVVTRSYILQVNYPGQPGDLGERVRGMIVQSFPDTQWDGQLPDGQAVLLTVLPDRIIVRQTPHVHEQVETLVTDSGIASPATPLAVGRGRGANRGGGAGAGGGGFGGSGGGGFFSAPMHQPRVEE
jgi:hypothetical protein